MKQARFIGLILAILYLAPASAAPEETCRDWAAYSSGHRGVALLVLKNGETICEHYANGGSGKSHELWSGTKSFVGVMAAAAVQDGLLSLDERVSETIAEWTDDDRKATITIRQLLSMTSGLDGKIGKPPSYRESLDASLITDPGARFIYSPTSMQAFGEVMRRKLAAAGADDDPVAYLERRVLNPAGISVAKWRRGPDGNPLMPQGAVMTARQWARFGEFIRRGGKADDRQLVDPSAFADLFRGSDVNPAYGLTWWLAQPTSQNDPVTALTDLPENADRLPDDLVFAAGAGGQRLYVIPSQGLTIVRLARLDVVAALARKPDNWSDFQLVSMVNGRDAD
jgi:CubicO group peptidase (beta-lactamase class C family)